jgi:purine-binding chemotaxis protein CheW
MPSLTRTKSRHIVLDWQRARERLAKLETGTADLDPERRAELLRERAQKLARRTELALTRPTKHESELELLHFRWGQEHYAISSKYVIQVIKPSEVTRLPSAPPHLRGIANLRGEILPVFDLREWFDVERITRTEESRWLVIGTESAELCLWADAVEEMSTVDSESLHRAERDNRHGYDAVLGVTGDAHTVLDGARLLTHPELIIGDTTGAGTEVAS